MQQPTPIFTAEEFSLGIETRNASLLELYNQLDWAIHSGEICGILGASGSGKTLLAMAAMNLINAQNPLLKIGGSLNLHVDSGTKTLFPPKNLKVLKSRYGKDIAMIFQEPRAALDPLFTIGYQWKEVIFAHEKMSDSAAMKRIQSIIISLGLQDVDHLLSAYPHQLSGGQLQRVSIGMAISHQPRLLIADEPTTSLDVINQKTILDLLKKLNREHGIAVWFISHDKAVLRYVCHSIYSLEKGKLQPFVTQNKSIAKEPMPVNSQQEWLLKANHLHYYYPKTTVGVADVSMHLEKSKIYGLLGISGSGKTTLGRMLCGLITPNTGTIDLAIEKRRIQLIFQHPESALDPLQTAGSSLMEILKIHSGGDKQERKKQAMSILNEVGLDVKLADSLPLQLSGGQKQRLCIARALAARPELLICDECVSSLDAPLKRQILSLLENLVATRGICVLFITHDIGLLSGFAHEIMVMENGKIIEQGPANELLQSPKTETTKHLIESRIQ